MGSASQDYRPDFLWGDLSSRFSDVLSEVSLESLCRQAAVEGVTRFHAESLEYQI